MTGIGAVKEDGSRPERQRVLLGAVLATYLALSIVYGVVTPLWEAPDEPYHYAYALHLASGGSLPVLDPSEPGPWRQEGGQPPLYYALLAPIIRLVPGQDVESFYTPNPHVDLGRVKGDGNLNVAIHGEAEAWPWRGATLAAHLARLFSALLGLATVAGAYLLARELLPDEPMVALGAAALTAFNPMFLFISGAITNDTLTIALSSQSLWLLCRLLRRPSCCFDWLLLGVVLGLAALGKMSALALLPLAGLGVLILGARQGWRDLRRKIPCLVLPVLAIAGWWYLRNVRLYGEISGLSPFLDIIGHRHPVPTLAQLLGEHSGLLRSYLGVFGWMNLPMPEWAWRLLAGIMATGWLAAPWAFWRLWRSGKLAEHGWRWFLVFVWPPVLLALLVRWTLLTPATQGRLLFPALSCTSLWVALGLFSMLAHRWASRLLGGVMACFLLVAALMPWLTIAPAYRPPAPLEAGMIPTEAERVDADLGGGVRLLAVVLPGESVAPGGETRLTLFWQADGPVSVDYTGYVHLTGANERIVAQRDRYPGQGLLPTSHWQPGAVYADTWMVTLPATLLTPDLLRIEVGLYDRLSGVRPGKSAVLGELVLPPRQHDSVPNPVDLHLGKDIALAGYAIHRTALQPGDDLELTLYWRARRDVREALTVFCQLRTEEGEIIGQHDGQPQQGHRPTDRWAAGEVIADRHVISVEPDAPEGAWWLWVGMYDGEGRRRTVLGPNGEAVATEISLTPIRVLPRTWAVP